MHANKPMPLLLLLTLMLATLASCATTSSQRSTEPTPTISCGEHAPSEKLPAYPTNTPMTGTVKDLLAENAPASEWAHALQSWVDYSNAQGVWAVQAAGVAQHNKILRGSTAACLDAYRKRGVIL